MFIPVCEFISSHPLAQVFNRCFDIWTDFSPIGVFIMSSNEYKSEFLEFYEYVWVLKKDSQ